MFVYICIAQEQREKCDPLFAQCCAPVRSRVYILLGVQQTVTCDIPIHMLCGERWNVEYAHILTRNMHVRRLVGVPAIMGHELGKEDLSDYLRQARLYSLGACLVPISHSGTHARIDNI